MPTIARTNLFAITTTAICLFVALPAFCGEPEATTPLKLVTPEPKTATEHNNRGVELGSKGLWEQALNEQEKALLAEPMNKNFRTNLSSAYLRYGSVLFKKDQCAAAGEAFRKALYVDPQNVPAKEGWDACLKSTQKDSAKNTDSADPGKQIPDKGKGP